MSESPPEKVGEILIIIEWEEAENVKGTVKSFFALKKQRTKKNKEEVAEYAKLLAKRMKEAKEKWQEQIAKRWRLSSLRASTSKSEPSQKWDVLKVTNK